MFGKRKFFALLMLAALLVVGVVGVGAQDDEMESNAWFNLRFGHFGPNAPAFDVYVDGQLRIEALTYPTLSNYLVLEEGSYNIAITPTGKGLDASAIGPADFEFDGGHDYTMTLTGLLTEQTFGATVIDETEAYEDAMTEEMGAARLLIFHGLIDAGVIDVMSGENLLLVEDVGFNDYAMIELPAGQYPVKLVAADDPDTVVADLEPDLQADTFTFLAATGIYPDRFEMYRRDVGVENVMTVLVEAGKFETLVAALTEVGLGDTLETYGPFTIFAPSDATFAEALDEMEMTEAELLEQENLREILLYHVVEGYWTGATLFGLDSAETMQDGELTINFDEDAEILYLNEDVEVIEFDMLGQNGVIHQIDEVLMPELELEEE